jgi:hypothetical protein
MFNSRQYEFSDMTMFMGNRDVAGLRGVSYTAKQEKEPVHGKGNMPMSIQKGNKTYEGEVRILQSELEGLTIGGRSVLDLEFDIVVNYGNPAAGDVLVTEILYGCQFTEEPKGMNQGDKYMEITLPMVFLYKKKIA